MNLLFVADPLEGFKTYKDTTFAMMREAARRGHALIACEPRDIAWQRATFACTPGLARPAAFIAKGLHAAGDYVAGPYPATLEGAVRSGMAAAAAVA